MVRTLLVNSVTTLFMKNKRRSEEKLAHTVGDCYKEEVNNDLNMRNSMDGFKQAIKKMMTNNKGVKPYGLYPKLFKKFKFNNISIC